MLDPISVTTTVITFATFIKDLIEVGTSIQESIEKVSENRRRIRELTNDVLHTLADIANVTRGQEDTYQTPALLTSLGHLKAEMLHIRSMCQEVSLDRRPGLRGFKNQIKAWVKRDDIEARIERLKEQVNKCYLQFTTFSAARTEQRTARIEDISLETVNTTLRVEQTLIVNNVESQVKLRRLEGMMSRMLLETKFGEEVMDRTMEIIASDSSHESLEFRYLSVQTMCLIDSIRESLTDGHLIFDASFCGDEMRPLVLAQLPSASHILHQILGMVLELNQGHQTQAAFTRGIMTNLGVFLTKLQMNSEGTAWHLLEMHILGGIARNHCSAGLLTQLVRTLGNISSAYQRQLQYEAALEASQQALDLYAQLTESFPDTENRPSLLDTMVLHALNLCELGQYLSAISIAQEAIALSHPMLEQIIQTNSGLSCLADEEEVIAVRSCDALFILAEALSSLGRRLESYAASKEGFQTISRFPPSTYPPHGADVDSFLDQICKVAEDGSFTLGMLADCVIILRDLARMYPKETSFQFLCLLHAYVYFSQQIDSSDMASNLRAFLEPNSDCPPPKLDIAMLIDLSGFDAIIEDTIRAFYVYPWRFPDILLRNIFVNNFEEAIIVLREVVESVDLYTVGRVLYSIADIVPFIPNANQMVLLHIATGIITQLGTVLVYWEYDWEWFLDSVLDSLFRHLWRAGLLAEALVVCEQMIKYFQSCSNPDNMAIVAQLSLFRMTRHFVLCDMGSLPDVNEMQQIDLSTAFDGTWSLHPYIIQIRILRRTERNQEALQHLQRVVAEGSSKFWSNGDGKHVFDVAFDLLLTELAAAWGLAGQPAKALRGVQSVVATCRKEVEEEDWERQQRKCILAHSLTVSSNCLASVRRNDEALAFAREAVSIYTENAATMWDNLVYTIRKQELGGNAFHALSLRLATFGEPDQALLNAEKAVGLHRELAALVPRHLPTLASSLRNLASTLWKIGRQDEAITACEEAVHIMRKVIDPETYFLPALAEALEQLAGYLTEKGDVGAASVAVAESTEIRRRFSCLPPQPDFLFEKIEIEMDDEDGQAVEEPVSESSISEFSSFSSTKEILSLDSPSLLAPTGDIPTSDAGAAIVSSLVSREPTLASDSAPNEEHKPAAKTSVAVIQSKPLELRLITNAPMDILCWLLVGILIGVVCRGVA